MNKEAQHKKGHVVFLGESGFPRGLAAIQRMTLMGKALLHVGTKVTVICRKGVWKKSGDIGLNVRGNFEGIEYLYTSKSVFRPNGFINRNFQKIKGMYGEYTYLKDLKRTEKINVAIISNMSAFHVLRYLAYSALLNFPVVLNLVEMASSMKHKTSFSARVNNYLLDNWIIKLFDGALPISDKLMEHYKAVSPSKPSLKLPILCDYDKFNIKKKKDKPYFLYCGSLAYREVIDFIIEAYQCTPEIKETKLFMIISGGTQEDLESLQQRINSLSDTASIKLFSNIPYEQLVLLYTNASALLIPIRPTVQDTSRFPHKIGEYLASGNPIITTRMGEIKNYFEDGKTALIADSYSIGAFAHKMKYALSQPELSRQIGKNGKKLGLKEFDYKVHGARLLDFLQKLWADSNME